MLGNSLQIIRKRANSSCGFSRINMKEVTSQTSAIQDIRNMSFLGRFLLMCFFCFGTFYYDVLGFCNFFDGFRVVFYCIFVFWNFLWFCIDFWFLSWIFTHFDCFLHQIFHYYSLYFTTFYFTSKISDFFVTSNNGKPIQTFRNSKFIPSFSQSNHNTHIDSRSTMKNWQFNKKRLPLIVLKTSVNDYYYFFGTPKYLLFFLCVLTCLFFWFFGCRKKKGHNNRTEEKKKTKTSENRKRRKINQNPAL